MDSIRINQNWVLLSEVDIPSQLNIEDSFIFSSKCFPTASLSSWPLLLLPMLQQPRQSRSELHLVRECVLNDNGDDIANNIHIDPTAFPFLQRAAKLSSAAYTGCLGTAFDVTITKQIYNGITDTQVSIRAKIIKST